MKNLIDKRKMILFNLCVATLTLVAIGCTAFAEVKEVDIPSDLINAPKDKISRDWGAPHKIYTISNKLKYGADELWVYKYPDTSSEGVSYYLYFKEGYLIHWDNVVTGDL